MKKIITNLLIIFACYTFAVAQEKKSPEIYKNWEIGVAAGVANFAGVYNMFIDSRFNYFKTEINEYNPNNEWNLANLLSQNKFERKIYWYTKIGIGSSNFCKKAFTNLLNEKHLKLSTIPTENGLLFRINDQMLLNLCTQWSRVNSEPFDGHKTKSINIE